MITTAITFTMLIINGVGLDTAMANRFCTCRPDSAYITATNAPECTVVPYTVNEAYRMALLTSAAGEPISGRVVVECGEIK
jgi:hypothetical protein